MVEVARENRISRCAPSNQHCGCERWFLNHTVRAIFTICLNIPIKRCGRNVHPTVYRTDQDRLIYKAVSMPADATLTPCIGQTQFLRETACGVVPYGSNSVFRMKSCDFETNMLLLHPQKRNQLLCKHADIHAPTPQVGQANLIASPDMETRAA